MKKQVKPPGICKKCFEDPGNNLLSPRGNRLIYCEHGQAAATTGPIGWIIFWPISRKQMGDLIRETIAQEKTALDESLADAKIEH